MISIPGLNFYKTGFTGLIMKKTKKKARSNSGHDPESGFFGYDFSDLSVVDEVDVILVLTSYLRDGKTMDLFMADNYISKTRWDKWSKKRKTVRSAIVDGLVFYRAFWQKEAVKWSRDKNRSQAISKMLIEHAMGWEAAAEKVQVNVTGGGPGYKVIIQQPVPIPPVDADGVPISMQEDVNNDS